MDDRELFKLIRRIADIAFEYSSPKTGSDPWLQDYRREGINPFYNQTESGLFLEQYYDIPGNIWTPWGQWGCWGSGTGWDNQRIQAFLNRFGVVLYKPLKRTDMGEFGPVYALTSVDGIKLPPAVERPRTKYIPYDEAKARWDELGKSFKPEKPQQVACECDSWSCGKKISLPVNVVTDILRKGHVVIVDGCSTGPKKSDVLVEKRVGYALYKEGKS